MKVENVNSFVQGAQSTLSMVSGQAGKLGNIFVKNPPYTSNGLSVIIGIVGDLQGEVIYTMDESCGLYLASKLMAGFTVTEMDEMSISAVREVANMISGNAASALFSHGVKVDITPPTFVNEKQGDAFGFVTPGSKVLCMPLYLEGERIFEIGLHLKNNA